MAKEERTVHEKAEIVGGRPQYVCKAWLMLNKRAFQISLRYIHTTECKVGWLF